MPSIDRGTRVLVRGTIGPRMRVKAYHRIRGNVIVTWVWNGRTQSAIYDVKLLTRDYSYVKHAQR